MQYLENDWNHFIFLEKAPAITQCICPYVCLLCTERFFGFVLIFIKKTSKRLITDVFGGILPERDDLLREVRRSLPVLRCRIDLQIETHCA